MNFKQPTIWAKQIVSRSQLLFVLSLGIHVVLLSLIFRVPQNSKNARTSFYPVASAISVSLFSSPTLPSETSVALTPSDATTKAVIETQYSPANVSQPVRSSELRTAQPTSARKSEANDTARIPVEEKREPIRQIGLPPAPSYLDSTKLDPPPIPLHDIDPEYPATLSLQEGTVVLRLLINEKGTVDNAAVVKSFPPGMFDNAALVAFGKAEFSPGKWLGIPVKSQITVEVEFAPINRGANVTGRSY